jgi:hypothetical protein
MDLVPNFRGGVISGEGVDGVGAFGIDGHYDAEGGECFWVKTYFGRHSVEYTGYREQKGIWGTWKISRTKGGFHIWPIGDGVPVDELKSEVEEEFTTKVSTGVPQLQPAHSRLATAGENRYAETFQQNASRKSDR